MFVPQWRYLQRCVGRRPEERPRYIAALKAGILTNADGLQIFGLWEKDVLKKEDKREQLKKPMSIRCKRDHELTWDSTKGTSRSCDICGKSCSSQVGWWRCQPCGYDACNNCAPPA